MKVLVLTLGTRGDVQPFVALSRALMLAGHEVALGAPSRSRSLAEPHGVQFIPLYDRWDETIKDPTVSTAFETNFGGVGGWWLAIRAMRKFRPMMADALVDMAAAGASYRPDVVVHHAMILGHEVAERLGVPAVPVCVEPLSVPTSSFANPILPFRVPRLLNSISYRASDVWVRGIVGDRISARWRREILGLPHRRGHRDVLRRPDGTRGVTLQAVSPALLPQPVDYPDWAHTTGFWFLPAAPDWTPPEEVADFLAAGEAPVYIGFGSLVGSDPERTGRVVAEAVRLAGVRAIIDVAQGGIRPAAGEEDVLYVSGLPFDWLFPRMALIVHHGGIGTTAVAMATGRRQIVCPFMTGQHFYAHRMYASGVAAPPQPQSGLTAERLARAIRDAVADDGMALRAERLGRQVSAEDGLGTAVRILEKVG